MYYSLEIIETGRNTLKADARCFGTITKKFETKEEAREYLKERYGRMPSKRNKIYVDDKEGNQIEVGFTYSYWNKDCSHDTKSWYQTDWISLEKVLTCPTSL